VAKPLFRLGLGVEARHFFKREKNGNNNCSTCFVQRSVHCEEYTLRERRGGCRRRGTAEGEGGEGGEGVEKRIAGGGLSDAVVCDSAVGHGGGSGRVPGYNPEDGRVEGGEEGLLSSVHMLVPCAFGDCDPA